MVLAVVFAACSHRQDGDTTTATSAQYEALRRDVAAMLSDEPDSVFAMLDRLEISDQYPYCVVNLIRGNMYGQMMSLRFAEFYLREAIGEELNVTATAQSRTTTSQCSAYASAKAMRLNLLGKIMAIKQQLSKIICTFAVVKRKRQA